MKPKNRHLKVVRAFSNQKKASLPLSGFWLEKAGFTVGRRVEVIVREECLVIIPLKENK